MAISRWWGDNWRGVIAAAVSVTIGWIAFVAGHTVPILDWFDLAIHETGHLLTGFMPDMIMFLAGSASQVLFPLGMAWYFGVKRREMPASGFCLAWAGTSAWDVSVYVADARTMALPLVGGGTHDWNWILGPSGFDALDRTAQVAGFVRASGALLVIAGIAVSLWPTRSRVVDRIDLPLRPVRAARPVQGDPWAADASAPPR